eukprot:gene8766-7958_t
MSQLFVGGLADGVKEEDLRATFATFGKVNEIRIVRSKGIGFVEFHFGKDGEEARRRLNGQEFFGKTLRVTMARDKDGGATPSRSAAGTAATGAPQPWKCPQGGESNYPQRYTCK